MAEELGILGGKPVRARQFPMEMPQVDSKDILAVSQVLRERRLSIFSSSKIEEFESEFAKYIGTEHAIAVNSGTAALHAALIASNVRVGDEVIVPVYTYAATINAVLLQRAKPVFIDIEKYSFSLDVSKVHRKINSNTKAIILVDLFGVPSPRKELQTIAKERGLVLIGDCAQSTGAIIHNQQVGSFGIGCHSFGEIKNITTAEGGMVTTNDPEVARIVRLVRHAGEAWRRSHVTTIGTGPDLMSEMIDGINYEIIGHNYRMNALQAALGISQLKKITSINAERVATATYFNSVLNTYQSLEIPYSFPGSEPVFNRYSLMLTDQCPLSRLGFLASMIAEGIPVGVYYPKPLNRAFSISNGLISSTNEEFPVAEEVCMRQVLLPCYPGLTKRDREDVVKAVDKVLRLSNNLEVAELVESKAIGTIAKYFGQFFSLYMERGY